MKKRKLNSKNPKYAKAEEVDNQVQKVLIKKVKGVKVYAVFNQ
tara:strand:+ start:103 stop:231 length:129 start_codon:yes stop_codon:yes gene_type:complete